MLIYGICVFIDSKFVATNWRKKKEQEKTDMKEKDERREGKGDR